MKIQLALLLVSLVACGGVEDDAELASNDVALTVEQQPMLVAAPVMMLVAPAVVPVQEGACDMTVLGPNGGEELARGEPALLTWRGSNGAMVRLRLRSFGAYGVSSLTIGTVANTGQLSWAPPATFSAGSYQLVVADDAAPDCFDTSDDNFTLR